MVVVEHLCKKGINYIAMLFRLERYWLCPRGFAADMYAGINRMGKWIVKKKARAKRCHPAWPQGDCPLAGKSRKVERHSAEGWLLDNFYLIEEAA